MIKKIKLKNFKNFNDLEISLGNFNVVIGANASGKSNFVQIFRFLKEVKTEGLNNAISMQGGVDYLRNINIPLNENFTICIVFGKKFTKTIEERNIEIRIEETVYEFALRFKGKQKGGPGFEISEDRLSQKCEFFDKNNGEKIGEGTISLINEKGKIEVFPEGLDRICIKEEDIYPRLSILKTFKEDKLSPNALLFQNSLYMSAFLQDMDNIFNRISIYDFDPKLAKKATPISGKAELEEDGSNLSIVLKNIMENKEERRRLFNLVKNVLPFINNIDIDKSMDKSLLLKFQEIYFSNTFLPASLISDGTINITGLIIALYFKEDILTIIEEPERNIHPSLISKIVLMMKEASEKKQIIVTTHNPEIIKYAGLENIFLLSRDRKGFSTISKPPDKEEVKIFLKNEIGIEELFVQNLLGI